MDHGRRLGQGGAVGIGSGGGGAARSWTMSVGQDGRYGSCRWSCSCSSLARSTKDMRVAVVVVAVAFRRRTMRTGVGRRTTRGSMSR